MSNSRLVYSSSGNNSCPSCHKPLRKCRCKSSPLPNVPQDGVIRISRQTKGRKGKGVTLISGLPLSTEDLKTLAKELKTLARSGGTVKGAQIEIQGDHRQLLKLHLEKQYPQVKLAGG